jgi:dTDP-4-dehydrorhamnose 3,5-epimerase
VNVAQTSIPGVLLIDTIVHRDYRGLFVELWSENRYAAMGIPEVFRQDNHSQSVGGSLRGLHYQIEQPQGKLVQCLTGSVFDVAVDLRRSSPTFGRWLGVTLSAQTHQQLWIPAGMAHGFYVLSESADVIYKCTEAYSQAAERCIRWDDPTLAIDWPLVAGTSPRLSPKDAAGLLLTEAPTFP